MKTIKVRTEHLHYTCSFTEESNEESLNSLLEYHPSLGKKSDMYKDIYANYTLYIGKVIWTLLFDCFSANKHQITNYKGLYKAAELRFKYNPFDLCSVEVTKIPLLSNLWFDLDFCINEEIT